MVHDVIASSWGVSGLAPELPAAVGLSQPVLDACNQLRDFLFERVYHRRDEAAEEARTVVRNLYRFLLQYPHRMPEEYAGDPERGAVDYIAGMTDLYATKMAMSFGLI